MATFYHPQARLNWQSNQDIYQVGYDGVRLVCVELELTTAQLAVGSLHNFINLDGNTVVLGGWVEFDELDSHATALFDYDIGYVTIEDTPTTDADAYLNGGVISGGGPANVVLTTGVGTSTATFLPGVDYTVQGKVIAAPNTAAAGTIKLCLLLADSSSANAAAVGAG